MGRSASASSGIVPRAASAAPAAYRALVRAGLWRARNAARSLPLFLRFEIAGLTVLSLVLLATYGASSYYDLDPGAVAAPLATRVSRVLAGCLAVAALALSLLAPRVSTRGGDARGLAALPVPASARAAFRADRLAFLAIPAFVLGLGMLFHPVQLGRPDVSAFAVPAWAAWLWATAQIVAAIDALCLEGRWGPGLPGLLGRAAVFLSVPLVVWLYGWARELTALIVDPARAPSFGVTAVAGLVLGVLARAAAVRAGAGAWFAEMQLAERLEVRRWKRSDRVPEKRAARWPTGRSAPLDPVVAWLAKDARVVLRLPALRSQWILAALLLVLPSVVVLRPDAPAWVFAGLVVVLGAAAVGVGVLLLWFHEQPMFVFSTPVRRRVAWTAKAAPGLTLVLGAALALSALAWSKAGAHTGRILFLWTGVSGASLVLAAANLGQASPPRSPLGQNLYGLGLFSCVLVGSVCPGIGWLVLAAFAGYTLHSLARDPRS